MEERSPYAPFVANLEAQRELLNIFINARERKTEGLENMDWSEVYQYLKSKYVELLSISFYNKPELHSSIVRIEYGKPSSFYDFEVTDEEIRADASNAHSYIGMRVEAFIKTNILGEKDTNDSEEKDKSKTNKKRNGMSKQQRQIKKEWML